jgi:hypothetical protein
MQKTIKPFVKPLLFSLGTGLALDLLVCSTVGYWQDLPAFAVNSLTNSCIQGALSYLYSDQSEIDQIFLKYSSPVILPAVGILGIIAQGQLNFVKPYTWEGLNTIADVLYATIKGFAMGLTYTMIKDQINIQENVTSSLILEQDGIFNHHDFDDFKF